MSAVNNKRLLAAVKEDNEDLLREVIDQPGTFDINYQDGVGKTALHYAVLHQSTSVIKHILRCEQCDVDPIDRIDHVTPLHLAVKLDDPESRLFFVKQLLSAGADYTIRNKYNETALDLVRTDDRNVRSMLRKYQAAASIDKDDIADDDDDDDDDGSD